jgi:poly(3-hydroxybutyrate) depolymerase
MTITRLVRSSLRLAGAALLLCAATSPLLAAEVTATGFQPRVYRDDKGEHKYMVFIPAAYTPERQWPVILYLHNASDCGTDNELPLVGGLGPQVRARAATFPFIVVFPQCEDRECRLLEGWLPSTPDAARALKIFDEVERDFSVDHHHEILTGWSMGGAGSWLLGSLNPSRWSAIVSVAGGGEPATAAKLVGVPIWAFHGSKDLAVPIEQERKMVDTVKALGGHAHFTELPGVRHNIGHVVYAEDCLYEWMLHPETEPQDESFVHNAQRAPSETEMGHNFDHAFIPGVEIPNAVYIHLDQLAIDTMTNAAPDLLPTSMLAGAEADVHQAQRAFFMQLNVTLSGISYQGSVERLTVTTSDSGWLTLSLGLRNMTMQIGNTQLNGSLVSAEAGPMQIVIAQQRPVWLTLNLRPYIEDHRLRFELGHTNFSIPSDDFYVTTPHVEAHGLPIVRGRVAQGLSNNLVSGAYGRKAEIEEKIRSSAPVLVQHLEEKLDKSLWKTRTVGTWPVPAYQPRFRAWPQSVHVDQTGMALVVGVTVARPAFDTNDHPVRRFERPSVRFDAIPKQPGMQVAMSSAIFEGFTNVMVESCVARGDARDLGSPEFAQLGDMKNLIAAIPDLARYGDKLQVRTDMQMKAPLSCSQMPGGTIQQILAENGTAPSPTDLVQFRMPLLRFVVQIKTSPEQEHWQHCAEFDITLNQPMRLRLDRPNFESRAIRMDWQGVADVRTVSRFAEGYEAKDKTLNGEFLGEIFRQGWASPSYVDLLQHMEVADVVLGSGRLRAQQITWVEPFMVQNFVPAQTRVSNAGSEPLSYLVRGPFSNWGGPFVIAPGKSHDFPESYPITIQQIAPVALAPSVIPMGTHVVLGKNAPAQGPQVVDGTPEPRTARQ